MSAPHFWTRKNIALLGTDFDDVIAKRLGIRPSDVFLQRRRRGIRAFGTLRHGHCKWGQTEIGLLRNYTDQEIAKLTGRSLKEIAAKRRSILPDS
jgi:hypothetical protein